MNISQKMPLVLLALAALFPAYTVSAQGTMHHGKPSHGAKLVGYDAKDKRYYSVTYAKSHGMHDKGGDPLTIVPMSSLPKEAKESKAMHGAKI